jgi:hypothetical protein
MTWFIVQEKGKGKEFFLRVCVIKINGRTPQIIGFRWYRGFSGMQEVDPADFKIRAQGSYRRGQKLRNGKGGLIYPRGKSSTAEKKYNPPNEIKNLLQKNPLSFRSSRGGVYISQRGKICQLLNAAVKKYSPLVVIIFFIFPENGGHAFP